MEWQPEAELQTAVGSDCGPQKFLRSGFQPKRPGEDGTPAPNHPISVLELLGFYPDEFLKGDRKQDRARSGFRYWGIIIVTWSSCLKRGY